MEPNKIDKQFREKLNARHIQPSAQSWDRLDAMLSVAEENKTKRPFGFLIIAAGILVLVSLGVFLHTQNDIAIVPVNSLVESATKNDTLQSSIRINQTPTVGNENQNDVVVTTNTKLPTSRYQESKQKTIINQKTSLNQSKNVNQNQIINDKAIVFENTSDVAVKELSKISSKDQNIDLKPNYVDVDELLQSVEKGKTTAVRLSIKVNAASLLSQVDGEVEHTFREKVFTKINKNYQQIKVALSNRNQE
jgi:hypothetical protein